MAYELLNALQTFQTPKVIRFKSICAGVYSMNEAPVSLIPSMLRKHNFIEAPPLACSFSEGLSDTLITADGNFHCGAAQ